MAKEDGEDEDVVGDEADGGEREGKGFVGRELAPLPFVLVLLGTGGGAPAVGGKKGPDGFRTGSSP